MQRTLCSLDLPDARDKIWISVIRKLGNENKWESMAMLLIHYRPRYARLKYLVIFILNIMIPLELHYSENIGAILTDCVIIMHTHVKITGSKTGIVALNDIIIVGHCLNL